MKTENPRQQRGYAIHKQPDQIKQLTANTFKVRSQNGNGEYVVTNGERWDCTCPDRIYREVKWKELPKILLDSTATTAIVMLLVGASMAMSWIISYENIPQNVSAALVAISDSRIIILLIINLILLLVGTFMDMTPAVLIFTPIFLPVVMQLGVDPVHFGIIMVLNLCTDKSSWII